MFTESRLTEVFLTYDTLVAALIETQPAEHFLRPEAPAFVLQ